MASTSVEEATYDEDESEEIFVASQWQLMWWRFKRHRPAIASSVILLIFYLASFGAEFLGTGDLGFATEKFHYLRPQPLRWFDNGKFSPHVNGLVGFRDPATFKKDYATLPDEKLAVGFFVRGFEYTLLGFRIDRHLVGLKEYDDEQRPSLFLLGTDKLGRDVWSRLMIATRISLSIGMVGTVLSFVLGIALGAISGFYGGWIDQLIQRFIEFLIAIPTLPLWMGLSAAIPQEWTVIQVYLALTIILSFLGWTGMARVVRGKFLSLREEDFVMAARLAGASEMRVMFRHMVPSFTSHIVASASLAIPYMIIGETGLSFLGLGLRPPAVSWGVMLQDAQNVQTVALYPWLMIVAVPVTISILAFNFMGDGLRDAADPYSE
jgi:peptide/nickel transport system permease protein